MPLRIQREGATPNLLKYSVEADEDGGTAIIDRDSLIRDSVRGPLRTYVERAVHIDNDDDACHYFLCNPSMRVFITPRTLRRFAVDARTDDIGVPYLEIIAEPGAIGILALEFRHTLSA